MISETRYAKAGDTHIAYKVIGGGPIDILANIGFISHVEHLLSEPRVRSLFERMGEFARVMLFDRRGAGLSDPVEHAATLEQQLDDATAVLDAEGSQSAALYGFGVGAPFALLLAASEPERISHVMISSGFARMTRADDYPYGNPPEVRDALIEALIRGWGSGTQVALALPSLASDPDFREWAAALERQAAAPGAIKKFLDLVGQIDVRPVLASVGQPTLVMHAPATLFFERGHTDYLVEQLPDATYVELPGADLTPISEVAADRTVAAIEEFLTGRPARRRPSRALRTLLFTDIVDSTQLAAEIGDSRWHELLDRHDTASRAVIADHRGAVVKTTGDGIFASFDGPERAVRCAKQIQTAIESTGLEIRAGVHTGECELRGNDLAGISVHIAARVAATAEPNQLLITRTVKDLVTGSDLALTRQGEYELKGIPETWELFAVN